MSSLSLILRAVACAIALVLAACGSKTGSTADVARQNAAPEPDVVIDDGLVEALAEDADPHTLYIVGNQYATGDGAEKDQNIAERLWRVACDKGHAYACSIYGARQIEHKNYEEAARTLTIAGENGVKDAIANLIELHDSEAWPGASAEEAVRWHEALQLLQSLEVDEVGEVGGSDQPTG